MVFQVSTWHLCRFDSVLGVRVALRSLVKGKTAEKGERQAKQGKGFFDS